MSDLAQMLGLGSEISGAIAHRVRDDSGPTSRAQCFGQRLKRLDVTPVARQQEDRTGICLRHRIREAAISRMTEIVATPMISSTSVMAALSTRRRRSGESASNTTLSRPVAAL